jgi:hypothetical protein
MLPLKPQNRVSGPNTRIVVLTVAVVVEHHSRVFNAARSESRC